MRVYVAGPISIIGPPHWNRPAFLQAAANLRAAGHEPVNPHDIARADPSRPNAEFYKRDIPVLLGCDAVYALPRWDESPGALLEVFVACMCGLRVYDRLPLVTPLRPDELPPGLAATLLVRGARQRDYAHPRDNFRRIARGWEVIFGQPVSNRQVGAALLWLKVARDLNTPKHDNLVDEAGYAEATYLATKEE